MTNRAHSFPGSFRTGLCRTVLLLFAVSRCWAIGIAAAQESEAAPKPAPANASFDEQSLALRTALHYDPSLQAPINSLVSLYQKADRIEELVGLYRGHIGQYPDDPGAKTVLIQILRQLNRTEADEMVQAAVQQHPDNALVHLLLYEYRARRQDERALESLSKAIELETKPGRRDVWLEMLLEKAGEGADRLLAEGHLKQIRAAPGHTIESLLALADRMHRFGFHELALATLDDAAGKKPGPEANVEIEMLAAKSQGALGDRTGAGGRLDALIDRLAPDYWRRSEIMSLRINLLSSDAERKRLLSEARIRFEANPESESAVLEYAELLYAGEERIEAARVLTGACGVLPNSERIESEAIKVLERLGDDEKLWKFLTARLEQFPERRDLRYRLVKSAYLLGKKAQAEEDLKMVLDQFGNDEERRRQRLDLARFLRRSGFNEEAAVYFSSVLSEEPGRFDVRRELAETHLAGEDRLAAALVLADLPVREASIENFTDLVQFMVENGFLLEADEALKRRLEMEPESFELPLYLVEVSGKTGNRSRAEDYLLQARGLADTPARYRRWLETGLAAHELFGDAEMFFNEEQDRFSASIEGEGEWTPEKVEKFLAFCEIGKRGKLEGRVTQVLRNWLAEGGLPADFRIKLRLLLVDALEKSRDHADEVEQQLRLLAEEDGARADQYSLRRALLYHTMQRPDLAQETLASVEVGNVREVAVLKAAAQVLIEYAMFDRARACLEGITREDPQDLNNWERRMTLLAAMGQEDELRRAIRHLLAGVDQISLSLESLEALQLHLADSYWRTVARLLSDSSTESFAEVFPYLEAVERENIPAADRLWTSWVRAHALNALGRVEEREAAIAQLEKLAGSGVREGAEPAIAFPDGLTVTLRAAGKLLRQPAVGLEKNAIDSSQDGPLGALAMAWAFESDPGSRILQIEPVAGGLLVLDDQGTVYRVDRESGKLVWRERFGKPETERRPPASPSSQVSGGSITISNPYFQVRQQGASINVRQMVAPFHTATITPGAGPASPSNGEVSDIKLARRFATDGVRFYLSFGQQIQARLVEDGGLAWEAFPGKDGENSDRVGLNALARPEPTLIAEDDRLFAFFPESGVAAAFDSAGGKMLWIRELGDTPANGGDARPRNLFSLNCGASFSGNRLFVYGDRSQVLDAETGETIWSFEGGEVRAFPVRLVEAANGESDSEGYSAIATFDGNLPKPGYLDHLSGDTMRPEQLKSFFQYRGALVAPAVHWSGMRFRQTSAATAAIEGERVLLMDDGVVRQVSLRLPLASRQFDVRGVFLGLAGSSAWFLDEKGMTLVELNQGDSYRFPVRDAENAVTATLSGSRTYVVGPEGVSVLNAHSGDRIMDMSWPEEFLAYRSKVPEGGSGAPESIFLRQGVAGRENGLALYCYPIVERVRGRYLFVSVGDSRVVAFRSGEPKAAKSAP